jgi:alcohol dehydrogenase class IV
MRTKVLFGSVRENLSGLGLRGRGLLCCRRSLSQEITGQPDLYRLAISPEPTVEDIRGYWQEIRGEEFDYVIAIGGGSVLDTAKILAAQMTNGGDPADFIGEDRIAKDMKTLVAVPTTHGSGSEVTKYAVVKLEDAKRSVVSEKICPHFAIIDVDLVMGLPRDLTLYTSIDALCHSVESYLTRFSNPLVDIVCEAGIRSFFEGLDGAMEDRRDGRERMMLCSLLGGIAITWGQAYIVHALSHVLGARLDIPHGMANAVFLPGFLRFFHNHPKVDRLRDNLGFDPLERLGEIYDRYGAKRLSDFVSEREAAEIARAALSNRRLMRAGEREMMLDDLLEIVRLSLQA